MAVCHLEIKPITLFLNEDFLFRREKADSLVEVEVFALSSYPKSTLTAKIRIKENGAVFDFIPFHKLYWKKPAKDLEKLDLKDLVYCNSPSKWFCVHSFKHLKSIPVWCWFKNRNFWVKGEYVLTVDWYKDNENLNLVRLETGQMAALPNHKCLFLKDKPLELTFPAYRAIHDNWKV